jgi:hypothetical protein
MIKKILGNSLSFKKQPRYFYFFLGLLLVLILYVVVLFFYLKIVGFYGIATITGGVSTSEGNDYTYEFPYKGEKFTGSLSGLKYEIGSKYFVLFYQSDPDKSFLQYNEPVPDCFKDSINSVWKKIPQCFTNNE